MLEKKAVQFRLKSLLSMYKAGLGNIGNAMSDVEILTALYYGDLNRRPVMNVDDYLILSKVCAAPVQYAVLADKGFFDESELDHLGQNGSMFKEWPNGKVPGVSATLTSEGQGLSVALGIALSLKMERRANRVFVLMGDTELQKGQVWEACNIASYYNLDNLVVFVDNPALEIDPAIPSNIRVVQIQNKFASFGWDVVQVLDGHNFDQLLDGLSRAFKTNRKPVCVWCHTIAGKGIEFAERKASYLKARLSENEVADIIPKLQKLI